jgi:hypothetical protein
VSLYLYFLRISSFIFALISLVNFFQLIIFATGDPLPQDDFRKENAIKKYSLQAFTVLNITANIPKVYISFFNSMLTFVALVIYMIALYLNKFRKGIDGDRSLLSRIKEYRETRLEMRQRLVDLHTISHNPQLLVDKELSAKVYTELDIADHTVMFRGLP